MSSVSLLGGIKRHPFEAFLLAVAPVVMLGTYLKMPACAMECVELKGGPAVDVGWWLAHPGQTLPLLAVSFVLTLAVGLIARYRVDE